jgi:branched-chain amino acid transport system substrate-binding protein
MDEKDKKPQHGEVEGAAGRSISRREFLKVAGIAGAAVSLGAGLGGVVAACGGTEETTTTAPASTETTAGVTTTAGATTTVSAGPEGGRDIILGLVSPSTGPLALFAKADDWWVDFALKTAAPDGIIAGDGKLHKIVIKRADSQSDSNRAAQVAGDLVTNDKVDLMMASGSPDTANPVADQCEALGCPSIANFVPWQPFYFGRGATPDKPFKWTFAHALGLEDIVGNFISMWEQVPTNKKVGFLFANDADGQAWTDMKTGLPPAVKAAGYDYFLSDLYTVGTEDYTKYISDFKKNGCEICCGTVITPDFTNFWKQSVQQGYNPKVLTIGKALLFPQTLDAIGPIAYNATVEGVWEPSWPYKDSITGKNCQELADAYMAATGEQWTAPIAQYAKFEWAVDVFKRVKNIDDKEEIVAAVGTTKLDTCLGPIDFTAPVDMTDLAKSQHPVFNVYKCPVGGAQWIKGTKFNFEPVMVSNANHPDLPVVAKVQPMAYGS